MDTFDDTGLKPTILQAVKELGFVSPTPIQAKTIPHLLNSTQDLIALAQTGTGKTAAFGLPVIQLVDENSKNTQALILCPTRELCLQITRDLKSYSKFVKGLAIVPVYGGTSIDKQIRALKKGAQVVVATPGRAKDLIQRKKLLLNQVNRVVLDEADEMLSMGFKEDLDAILSETSEDKQTLLFSATLSKEIARIAKNYMDAPEQLSVARLNVGAENVQHLYYMVRASDRYEVVKRIADMNPNIYGIVFCRTRMETKEIAAQLMTDGYNADAIHGDLSQAQRDEVMNRFRSRKLQLLIATDVAARGLDVNDLTHVINYKLPDSSEIYTHRSGRTGRAGKSGISIAIIHSREQRKIQQIERQSKVTFTKAVAPTGREICEKQLYALIDRIKTVNIDEQQITTFLPEIYEKLSELSREDLIKRFVSNEFNQFLDYYKNARDININSGRDDRRDRRDDRGRDRDRRRDRDRDRDRDRGRDRDRDRNPREKRSVSERRNNSAFTRLFVNLGSKNKVNPAKLIGLINNTANSSSIEIGKIEILRKFSFFEIEKGEASDLLKQMNNSVYDGVPLLVEEAQPKKYPTPPPHGKFKKKKSGGSKNYAKLQPKEKKKVKRDKKRKKKN